MDDLETRYSRQIKFEEIGIEGQKKLQKSSVLCIGCGGLGSSCILYLAGCGIGNITVIDNDIVDVSNLHRQLAHTEKGALERKSKAISMKERIAEINHLCNVTAITDFFSTKNAVELVSKHDVIVDCCDNIPTRYIISDACVLCKKPFISAATQRWVGQITLYNYEDGPCFRCLNHNAPFTPDVTKYGAKLPVIPPMPGIMGCHEALEVIKLILNIGTNLSTKLLYIDGETNKTRLLQLRKKQSSCPACCESSHWTMDDCHDYILKAFNKDM